MLYISQSSFYDRGQRLRATSSMLYRSGCGVMRPAVVKVGQAIRACWASMLFIPGRLSSRGPEDGRACCPVASGLARLVGRPVWEAGLPPVEHRPCELSSVWATRAVVASNYSKSLCRHRPGIGLTISRYRCRTATCLAGGSAPTGCVSRRVGHVGARSMADFVVSAGFPPIFDSIGTSTVHASFAVLSFFFVLRAVKETKGLEIVEMP